MRLIQDRGESKTTSRGAYTQELNGFLLKIGQKLSWKAKIDIEPSPTVTSVQKLESSD